jgi:hypothetical protein
MPPRKPKPSKTQNTKRRTKAAGEGIAPAVMVGSEIKPKPKPEGYTFGRPTDYRPEFCEMVIEWGKLGKSKAWMAAELGIAKQTLYDWEKAHPDFLYATTCAMTHSQRWWEDAGQSGMVANLFNSTVWAKNMAARFRDEWTDRQEISGMDGAPLIPAIHVTTVSGSSA